MNGETLKQVVSFKLLEATLSKDGTSTAEVRIRIAMTISSMSGCKHAAPSASPPGTGSTSPS
ncbi:hypothetical protein DPMN_049738 [Dreissena polymorpha]|uniref:Uncharacterized protein n=1 Tax=Dreissena polymorpha TaxID=45954 RepID=A0A9D4HMG0_DREPO|nr:hypothetical protein DPMN_049738 [Dreissena polymorpha]